jgi:hypothetical protein
MDKAIPAEYRQQQEVGIVASKISSPTSPFCSGQKNSASVSRKD